MASVDGDHHQSSTEDRPSNTADSPVNLNDEGVLAAASNPAETKLPPTPDVLPASSVIKSPSHHTGTPPQIIAHSTTPAHPASSTLASTTEGKLALASRVKWLTSKREFRARAHSNPLNDGLFHPPLTPAHFNVARVYVNPPCVHVQWCDIGCGYGGLLASLSAAFPDRTMLGLEIRDRVADFCRRRLIELRQQHPGEYGNVWFERTNAMKFLPNYFARGTLEKLFFCYPDPHFKRKKNRQRIISTQLLAEYAYALSEGDGVAYVVTDVPELFDWMVGRFARHPLFQRRSDAEHEADIVSRFVRDMTDEAHRVDKSERKKQDASFRRVVNPI